MRNSTDIDAFLHQNEDKGGTSSKPLRDLPKCPTGIHGLDEITFGGLPRGRPTLICGSAGCGKTLLGMEFLIRGATEFDEPGVCISFEETTDELTCNVASLGFDIASLIAQKKLAIDHVEIQRDRIEEVGEYNLDGLFIRLGCAVELIGARRVLIDGIETLFATFKEESVLRFEFRRLFRWLKDRKLTAIVTGERGQSTLTRHGLEEYILDCVILLDHRISEMILTRRLRVVKYRGTLHGTNDYPFLIEKDGISVLPITSIGLNHAASDERVRTGLPALDVMFGGGGYFRGSSILISGTAGTGKTSLASHLVDAACSRGEKCIFFSFEESPTQIMRNMTSIGIYLRRWVDKGILHFHAVRPTTFGLETHLTQIHRLIEKLDPALVVIDPITGLLHAGSRVETGAMLLRLLDFLKDKGITAAITTLTSRSDGQEESGSNIASLVDAWLLLRDIEIDGERNRGLDILKARGSAHSNQIREFLLTARGIELRKVYLGEGGQLTGSARVSQEAKEAAAAQHARQEILGKQSLLEHKRRVLETQIAGIQMELESAAQEARQLVADQQMKLDGLAQYRSAMARSRSIGAVSTPASCGPATPNGIGTL